MKRKPSFSQKLHAECDGARVDAVLMSKQTDERAREFYRQAVHASAVHVMHLLEQNAKGVEDGAR